MFHTYISYVLTTQHFRINQISAKTKYKRKRHGRPSVTFSVSILDSITEGTSMVLSAIRIPSLWCYPYVQRLIKAVCFTKHDTLIKINSKTKYRGIYLLLFPLMFLSCAPTVHAMPGTNHFLIKG